MFFQYENICVLTVYGVSKNRPRTEVVEMWPRKSQYSKPLDKPEYSVCCVIMDVLKKGKVQAQLIANLSYIPSILSLTMFHYF